MTSAWFGGGTGRGSGADLDAARSAIDGAAQALLDLDTRQGYVDGALKTAREFADPMATDDLQRNWRTITERCFAASAAYLDASAKFPLVDSMGRDNRALDVGAARRAFLDAHRAMADASTAVDSFYRAHRERIDAAARAAAAVPGQIAAARRAANTVVEKAGEVGAANPSLLDLRTVTGPLDELTAALANLDAATHPRAQQAAASAVSEAADRLTTALDDAPRLAERVRSALPSIRTRLQSLRTRLERLPAAQSALWREFNQASSADLARHNTDAEDLVGRARNTMADAERALAAGDPESAHDAIDAARRLAHQVDGLIDDVTHRLDRLRAIRDDSGQAEAKVRFSIRDAQRLVVDRGLAGEWGSVLDAQSARVDRAVAALQGVHPDYWALVKELDAVRDFVGDVVERVRQSARQGGAGPGGR
ncbi:MAG: hypothetical protein WKF57_18450 [Nakamurella sp.]